MNKKYLLILMSLNCMPMFGMEKAVASFSKMIGLAPLTPAEAAAERKKAVEAEERKKAQEKLEREFEVQSKKVEDAAKKFDKVTAEIGKISAELNEARDEFQNASCNLSSQDQFEAMQDAQVEYNGTRWDFYRASTETFKMAADELDDALGKVTHPRERQQILRAELSRWRNTVNKKYNEVFL